MEMLLKASSLLHKEEPALHLQFRRTTPLEMLSKEKSTLFKKLSDKNLTPLEMLSEASSLLHKEEPALHLQPRRPTPLEMLSKVKSTLSKKLLDKNLTP